MRTRFTAVLVIVMSIVAMSATIPARAAVDAVVVSPPGGFFAQGVSFVTTGFTPPAVAVSQNGSLTYVNADPLAQHNVVSEAKTTDPALWDMAYCPYEVGAPAGWTPGSPIDDAWKRANACPLFYIDLLNAGQSKRVPISHADGTPKLTPGTRYEFFCQPHKNMRGLLVVLPPVG